MRVEIAVLAGDGIGPAVVAEGKKALEAIAGRFGHSFSFHEGLVGGCAIDAVGNPLPEETLRICRESDAVLVGAVGGPQWSDPTAAVRPEQGLLRLRRELGLFANLRPVRAYPALLSASPLRPDLLHGVDLLVVRELAGGIYFGERQEAEPGTPFAYDTMGYHRDEVARIAHRAFQLAHSRRGLLTSVDKANVLATSRLWRQVVAEVGRGYPEVSLRHELIDAAAMRLVRRPSAFDVLVTSNMFGDILTDEASVLGGSIGMLPSASLSTERFGLYEPIHGSAPDIAGQGMANPLGTILSVAMLLRHTLQLHEEAWVLEKAVEAVLDAGYRTPDIASAGTDTVGTREMGDLIADRVGP